MLLYNDFMDGMPIAKVIIEKNNKEESEHG